MTALKYWDAASATYKVLSGPPGPIGPTGLPGADGAIGPAGPAGSSATLPTTIPRNLVQNPLFNLAQKGRAAVTTTGEYPADRWLLTFLGGSATVTPTAMTPPDGRALGDEAAEWLLNVTWTGGSSSGNSTKLIHRIENVRRLSGFAGSTTISFWARSNSGTPKIGTNLSQNYGTGGSPSSPVTISGQSAVLTNLWARYSFTLGMTAISSSAVFGTDPNSSYTELALWFSAHTTLNQGSGNIGVQSGNVDIWGVQVEQGNLLSPLEKPDLRFDVSNCQRYYQAYNGLILGGYQAAGVACYEDFIFATIMRAAPTVAYSNIAYSNGSGLGTNLVNNAHLRVSMAATALGACYATFNLTLTADL